MNYYPHHIGDYVKDTAHLSMLEDGAYRRMMDVYYSTERPLPLDRGALHRLLRVSTKAEKDAVNVVLNEFFLEKVDGWHHGRCNKEIEKARTKSKKASDSANKRWMGPHANAYANAMPTECEGNAPNNQEPITKENTYVPDGTLDCPHEAIIAAYHEVLPTAPRVMRWTEKRKTALKNRWRENANEYSTVEEGVAWWRRFFVYVSESDFLCGRAPPSNGRPPFVASLEWLVNSSNFVKVIEATYHA